MTQLLVIHCGLDGVRVEPHEAHQQWRGRPGGGGRRVVGVSGWVAAGDFWAGWEVSVSMTGTSLHT
jgi:hypothetical protein